jgi:hypothetical protein
VIRAAQAACVQVVQEQSAQVQLLQLSEQCAQAQALWLQVGQVQSAQSQTAQESLQFAQEQTAHSS